MEIVPTVHQTIGAFQIPMGLDISAVQVSQSLCDVIHEREFKHPVKSNLFLLQYVLQTSSLTKLHDEARMLSVDASSNKARLKVSEYGVKIHERNDIVPRGYNRRFLRIFFKAVFLLFSTIFVNGK